MEPQIANGDAERGLPVLARFARPLALGVFVMTAALALAACGGGAEEGGSRGAPGESPAVNPVIDQDNLKFIPNRLTVKAGSTVLFTNSDSALHTVTVDRKNVSGNMKKGDEFRWTPPAPGTYRITCDYHPQMRATLTVVE